MNDDLLTAYNYDVFIDEKFERWMRFDESPTLGEPAPDFRLTTLDDQMVHLSEIWKQSAYTIVEFGSLT
jgi:hypothetical protein